MSDSPIDSVSECDSDTAPRTAPQIAPTLQLSRRGLVISLASMVAVGLSVYALFPETINGPQLPVQAKLDRQAVASQSAAGATLTSVVVIENLSNDPIPRLGIEINGQYLLHRQSPLDVGESIVLPLRVFTDKRSSQRYDPVKYPPTEVIVTGQLPSGARGISKFEFH